MAPRTCPHCHERIPTDTGFSFDEKLNLICGNCGNIAFAVSGESKPQETHPYFPQPASKPSLLNRSLNSESNNGE